MEPHKAPMILGACMSDAAVNIHEVRCVEPQTDIPCDVSLHQMAWNQRATRSQHKP